MTARPKRILLLFVVFVLLATSVSQSVFASDHEQAQFAIPVLVVNSSFLNIRSGDGPQYTVIMTVVGGTELPALASNRAGTWYLVSTPIGNGWVDVSFTLPRGDFRFVPVISAQSPEVITGSLPLSIGLIAPSQPQGSAAPTTTVRSSQVGALIVLSVNLRSTPEDSGAVITTMYRPTNESAEYPVVGRVFDKRFVEWAAIVVPNFGTGWVEATKLSFRTVETTVTVAAEGDAPTTTNTGIPIPQLEAPIIIVNTGFQNIRTGPGGQYTVIVSVPGGTVFTPVGITADLSWYLVSGDFGFGWIASDYVLFRGEFRNVPILHNLY